MNATPTARSIQTLRSMGFLADKVEQRLPIPGGRPVTRDAFGFGDILACHPQGGILLVQATSRPNVNHRVTKVTADQILGKSKAQGNPALRPNPVRLNLLAWLRAGGRFEVWGWDNGIPRGETRRRWRCRRIVFGYNDTGLGWTEESMVL